MSDVYMNGFGVQERARELRDDMFKAVDAMWGALIPCYIGTCAAVLGPLMSYWFLIDRFPWEPQTTTSHYVLAIIISIASVVGGVWAAIPWFKASHEVRARRRICEAHTERMKAETAKHGPGWANS